jgi:3-oxoadipate CoA-transferase beta subunit
MTLFAKDGTPKLVPACTYPLTGLACVSRVYTDYATFEVGADGATVLESFGISQADLSDRLEVELGNRAL